MRRSTLRPALRAAAVALAVAAALAGAGRATAAPPTATRLDGAGCPILFDAVRYPPRASGGCRRFEYQLGAVAARPGVVLIQRLDGWDVRRRDATGTWLAVHGATGCIGGTGCLIVRGGVPLQLWSRGDGRVLGQTPAGLILLEVGDDGALSQPQGTGGCLLTVPREGCGTRRGAGVVNEAVIAEGAAYARSGGARIDVIGLDADGLAPRLGADGCASVDGTDGTGGSCVLVPRNVPIDRIAIAGAHLVISGTVGDAVACGGLCTELLLLDRAPVTGALSVGPLRCVGRGPACLVPRVPTGPYASIGATPDGRSLVLAGNGAANVFRVAPDGNLTQDAGVDGCIAISGRGGCLRATQFLGRAVAAGDDVLAFAGGTLTLFDRDATTGALTARTGVDACLGPEAPCHVVGTIADTRPLLLPDGHGAAVVEQLGLVALEPQSAPVCSTAPLATLSGVPLVAKPCSDPNGDPVVTTTLVQPQHGSLRRTTGGVIYTPRLPRAGRDRATISASDTGRTTMAELALESIALPAPQVERIVGAQPLGRWRGGRRLGTFFHHPLTIRGRFLDGSGTLHAGRAIVAAGAGTRSVQFAPDGTFRARLEDVRVLPKRSDLVRGRVLGLPGGLRASTTLLLVSPVPIWAARYRVVDGELRLAGQLNPPGAGREGTMRSERRAGRGWRPLASIPVSPGGRFELRAPEPGTYRIIWTPKRGRTRFNGFTWTMRLNPPRSPAGPRRSAAPRVVDLGGSVTP